MQTISKPDLMDSEKEVIHNGIVKEISGRGIKVGIVVYSACAGCHIKGACTMSEQADKELDIECSSAQFKIGQEVEVHLKTSQGFSALLLGYILPLITMIAVMVLSSAFLKNELIVALLSILSLIIYYSILFIFRKKIGKQFSYTVNPVI